MKILLIDRQVLFRQGLASLLSNEPGFVVVGEADALGAAFETLSATQPDLVIIDPILPDWNSLEAVQALLNFSPQTKILVLSNSISDELLLSSIQAGASGCLLKDTPISKLIVALHAIDRGEPALSRSMVGRIIEEFRRITSSSIPYPGSFVEILTEREIEILFHLGQNASNEEIAAQLAISENTVKVHIHNIIKKLNLRNRRQVSLLAQRSQLYQPNHKIALPVYPTTSS